MTYNIVAIKSTKPTLSVTPMIMEVGGRSILVELTDQQALQMAAILLGAINLKRKEEQ